jgi:sialidase-1
MSKKISLAFFLVIIYVFATAQIKPVAVFIAGTEGYKSFRIPAIVKLKNKQLLAFAEGRLNGASDFGDVNIVMKRSTDNGKTWNSLTTIVDNANLQAGNPAPVLDVLNPLYPNGKLFLFYNTGNNHESEVRKGKGLREVLFISSIDGGLIWSAPTNITTQVHHPNQPSINQLYHDSIDWRSYANTPGHAIQLEHGKYRGRLYVIGNHSAGPAQKHFTDYDVHGFYSDDHGKNFFLSQNLNLPGSNEAMAAELPDGKMMINARNQKADLHCRIISISSSGGESWDTTYYDTHLIDPVCQGSIVSLRLKKNKQALAVCNNADIKKRDQLTLRISFDNGLTWIKSYVIDKAAKDYKGDFTAYSDLVQMNKSHVGVLYEYDDYNQILFKSVQIK